LLRLWTSAHLSKETAVENMVASIRNWDDVVALPALESIWQKSIEILKILSSSDKPGLTVKKWVTPNNQSDTLWRSPFLDFQVLHSIASNDCPSELMKLALKLYPEEVLDRSNGEKSILDVALSHYIGLCQKSSKHPEMTNAIAASQSVVNTIVDHESVNLLYKFCHDKSHPPLHMAILAGKGWTNEMSYLCNRNESSLLEPDKETGLYPFMIAGTIKCDHFGTFLSDEAHIEVIFQLLRRGPQSILPWTLTRKASLSEQKKSDELSCEDYPQDKKRRLEREIR